MKDLKRYTYLTYLAGLLSIGISLLGYTNTYAVSVYDNTIQPDETFVIQSPDGLIVRDMATTWGGVITNTCTNGTSFNNAVNGNGSWFVHGTGDGETSFIVTWREDRASNIYFYTTAYDQYVVAMETQGLLNSCSVGLNNDGTYTEVSYQADFYQPGYNLGHYGGAYGNNPWKPWLVNWNIVYPEGYEGAQPIVEYVPPTVTPDLEADAKLYWKIEDKTLTLRNDTPIPPLNLNTMQCRYMVVDPDTTEAIIDKFTNCSSTNIQVVELPEYKVYEVIFTINYDVNGDGVILPDYEQIAEITFQADINGQTNEGTTDGLGNYVESNSPWEDCITVNEFPYIQFESCAGNISKFIGMLSFDRIRIGNGWTATQECHTLRTIGDWIPVENKTVCPAVPQNIRDIVSPFISVTLGLMALKFVLGREGGSMGSWGK